MKNPIKVGIIVLCLAILLVFSLGVAFAGTEKANATKSVKVTNKTTNISDKMANVTNKSAIFRAALIIANIKRDHILLSPSEEEGVRAAVIEHYSEPWSMVYPVQLVPNESVKGILFRDYAGIKIPSYAQRM